MHNLQGAPVNTASEYVVDSQSAAKKCNQLEPVLHRIYAVSSVHRMSYLQGLNALFFLFFYPDTDLFRHQFSSEWLNRHHGFSLTSQLNSVERAMFLVVFVCSVCLIVCLFICM